MKKLYKTNNNKMICGVCQGFSEYLNLDVSVIRLLMVLLGLSGAGIILYIAAAIILPENDNIDIN